MTITVQLLAPAGLVFVPGSFTYFPGYPTRLYCVRVAYLSYTRALSLHLYYGRFSARDDAMRLIFRRQETPVRERVRQDTGQQRHVDFFPLRPKVPVVPIVLRVGGESRMMPSTVSSCKGK